MTQTAEEVPSGSARRAPRTALAITSGRRVCAQASYATSERETMVALCESTGEPVAHQSLNPSRLKRL